MKEAFDRAIDKNPDSPVRIQVNTFIASEVSRLDEAKREKELVDLGDKLYLIGEEWFAWKISPVGFSNLAKEEGFKLLRNKWANMGVIWEEKGRKFLRRKEERSQLLGRLEEGIWYSDAHQDIAHKLLAFRATTEGRDVNSRKRLFLEGFQDLANCSIEQRADLKKGIIESMELSETIEFVANWMGTQISWIVAPENEYKTI